MKILGWVGIALIAVAGLILLQRYGMKSPQSGVNVQQKTQNQKNSATTWKTYSTIQYSLQYPSNWFVYEYKDANSCIALSDIQNPTDIPVKISPNGHTIIQVCFYQAAMPSTFPYSNGSAVNQTIKTFEINGYSGIRGQSASTIGRLVEIVFLSNPTGGYAQLQSQIGDLSIFDQILSTFKFTDQNTQNIPISGSYVSGQNIGGISITYPAGWKVNYKKEFKLSFDYKANYRATFDFAPPGWSDPNAVGYMGWVAVSFDVYDSQSDINNFINKYYLDYKDKIKVTKIADVGNKQTFLLDSNGDFPFDPRSVILGTNYSYEMGFGNGLSSAYVEEFRKEFVPQIHID